MKNLLIIMGLIFAFQCAKGQYLPEFSSQIKNMEFVNLGYNTVEQNTTLKYFYADNYRNGKDYNGLFAANLYIPITNFHTGLGTTLINESAGQSNRTNCTVNSCIEVRISKSTKLALGLGIGFERFEDEVYDEKNGAYKTVNSNFLYSSTGLILYNENLELGLAIHYTNTSNKQIFNKDNRIYFLTGGYQFKLGGNTILTPKLIYRYYSGKKRIETACFFNFNKLVETGISYRLNHTIILFVDLTLLKCLTLAYSYNYKFEETTSLTDGFHEFSLALAISDKIIKGIKIKR